MTLGVKTDEAHSFCSLGQFGYCYRYYFIAKIDVRIDPQVEVMRSRTSNDRLKLPPIVTYVTRLPLPSSPSGTSVSFVNQSSTITHERHSSSAAVSAWSPSPQPVHRGADEAAPPAGKAEPDGEGPPAVGSEVDGLPKLQHRRPSGIRSTLSCSQLLGPNERHRPCLVTVNSNPALMPRAGNGDDRLKDGPSPVSSA